MHLQICDLLLGVTPRHAACVCWLGVDVSERCFFSSYECEHTSTLPFESENLSNWHGLAVVILYFSTG